MNIEQTGSLNLPMRKFHIIAYVEDGQPRQALFEDDETGAEDFCDELAERSVVHTACEIEVY